MQQAKREREAATAIEKLGETVEWSKPSGPQWLRSLLGNDIFSSVTGVNLTNTQISDAGWEHLKGLSQLQTLYLGDTKVTDAGLEHLQGLSQLQFLYLQVTKVTDAGVKKLQQALPNCKIYR